MDMGESRWNHKKRGRPGAYRSEKDVNVLNNFLVDSDRLVRAKIVLNRIKRRKMISKKIKMKKWTPVSTPEAYIRPINMGLERIWKTRN